MRDLQNKVEELQSHNELQLHLREMTYREKLREVTDKFTHELEVDRNRYKQLEEEKDSMQRQYALRTETLNALQMKKLEELDDHHKEQLRQEKERYVTLERKMKRHHEQWDEEATRKNAQYAQEKEELIAGYRGKLQQERERRAQIQRAKEEVVNEFEDTKLLLEEDADQEIDELKASYDKKLTVETITTIKLKDQNAFLRLKFGELREKINDNLDGLQRMKEKQHALQTSIESLEKDIMGHVKEIKERESTIADKVHRIFELKKKNQELEKFKFVLDYKITELKRQIRPRELEMKAMSEQIQQMQAELKEYMKDSVHLQLEVRKLNLKSNGMDKEIEDAIAAREEINQMTSRFKTELHDIYQNIDNPKDLKEGIKRLFQRHVTSDLKTKQKTGVDDVHKDYQRQRHYLERSVDSLNYKLAKDMRVHKKDNQRIMQENIALIKEINELRREIKNMKDRQRAREEKVLQRRKKKSQDAATTGRRQEIEVQMEMQQEQIRALKAQLGSLSKDQPVDLEDFSRPQSRDNPRELPPI